VLRAVAVLGLVLAACSSAREPHRVRKLPATDGLPALRVPGAKSPRIANYTIDAKLDPVHHTLSATQTLRWTNPGQSAVTHLPFHLYLNAFKNESSVFMRSSQGSFRDAEATASSWGWITIDSVQIDGAELAKTLRLPANAGADETVVELPLATPLAPGASIAIDFRYTAQLPEVFARTGYHGDFHLIGQWFPKIGVRTGPPGAEQWSCEPLHTFTEFFADFGTYDVTLSVPAAYVVAATGVLVAVQDQPGGTRTYTYKAEDVHDFAWMADPSMETTSGTAMVAGKPVAVRVLARPAQADFAKRHLAAAIGTIEKMSEWFVPYPWSTMTVIDPPPEAALGAGGMEYPTFVTTAGDSVFSRPGVRLPEYVTVHEVGHNWFQGILASNEPIEAWLDEGVNEWADAKVMAALYGPRGNAIDWMGWEADMFALRRAVAETPGTLPTPIAAAAYAFADETDYAEQTYGTPMLALRTLELTFGTTKFEAAMKTYATKHAFTHPTGRDLFAALEQGLGQALGWFIGPVFQHVGAARPAVRSAGCRHQHAPRGVFGSGAARTIVDDDDAPDTGSYACSVMVSNTGTIHVPLDIELEFADGSTERLHWDDRGHGSWQLFEVVRSSPLAEVHLDPDGKLLLAAPAELSYRVIGDGSASLRAGAWFSSGTQTLMQATGL